MTICMMAFSIIIFRIMKLLRMTLIIVTFRIMALGMMTFSIEFSSES